MRRSSQGFNLTQVSPLEFLAAGLNNLDLFPAE